MAASRRAEFYGAAPAHKFTPDPRLADWCYHCGQPNDGLAPHLPGEGKMPVPHDPSDDLKAADD